MDEKYITSDKIFHHLDRLKRWESNKETYPISIEIHPTDLCNNKCCYCRYKKDRSSIKKRDFNVILKRLKKIGVKGIVLSGGGEPILNPETALFWN